VTTAPPPHFSYFPPRNFFFLKERIFSQELLFLPLLRGDYSLRFFFFFFEESPSLLHRHDGFFFPSRLSLATGDPVFEAEELFFPTFIRVLLFDRYSFLLLFPFFLWLPFRHAFDHWGPRRSPCLDFPRSFSSSPPLMVFCFSSLPSPLDVFLALFSFAAGGGFSY